MKNLFIDSNVWLSLYHLSNDDLVQFGRLKELIGKDINLLIPQQVCDEVQRNRETKLKDALEKFDVKSIQYPAFCKGYDEYVKFNADHSEIVRRYQSWRAKIDKDIKNQSLPADITIKNFFEVSRIINSEAFVAKAHERFCLGNPPGKNNSYGDAINWECLLATVPVGEDLYLVSFDKDYRSSIFKDVFNPFLEREWHQKKNARIFFYTSLTLFLNEHHKDIKLRTEMEKDSLISQLNSSTSFHKTHKIIAALNQHSGWTSAQIENLCLAVENNDQVGAIFSDPDVLDFYLNFVFSVDFQQSMDSATQRVVDRAIELYSIVKE